MQVGLRVEETKVEAYKAETTYLGISLAGTKISLILSLYFGSYSGKSLLFLTDLHKNMKSTRKSGILFKSFCAQCGVACAEHECGSDVHTVQKPDKLLHPSQSQLKLRR